MPVQVTYPGVYIEELPSGQHTLTGVATSITAFVGRALTGPVNEPTLLFNYGDYERMFGGLSYDYPISYAVQDFFNNGGSQAVVVRLFKPAAAQTTAAALTAAKQAAIAKFKNTLADPNITSPQGMKDAVASLASGFASSEPGNSVARFFVSQANTALIPPPPVAGAARVKPADVVKEAQKKIAAVAENDVPTGEASADGKARLSLTYDGHDLKLEAANPGAWGNRLAASIDRTGISSITAQPLAKYGLGQADLFNLTVSYTQADGPPVVERFISLCVTGDKTPNRIDRVLAANSNLVRIPIDETQTPPAAELPTAPPSGTTSVSTGAGGGSDSTYLDAETLIGERSLKSGIYSLEHLDLFNLLCIPPDVRGSDTDVEVYQEAAIYCQERRAMVVIDPPTAWTGAFRQGNLAALQPTDLGITGELARNAAVYFPRVRKQDLKLDGQTAVFPACGIVAGVMARTDVERGVWKAPAGLDAALNGIQDLELNMTDAQNGVLNPLGINCLRNFPVIGPVVWGARTLRGADQLADDYKYVPVRRLTMFIEESLYRGSKWAVFEPNDEALWSQLRLNTGSFMADLSRQGAFYGYRVVCDKTTTTQSDIDHGIVNILVAFAPVKPAEFVVIQIQQMAGQTPA